MTNATQGTTTPLKDRVADATARLVDDTQQKVKEEVRTRLDSGKRRTSDTLNAIASTLQQGEVPDEETAQFMRKAGDQVQRLSRYLENTDLPEMARQAENLARRQPVVFLGTAFILGLAAARFFKAGRNRSESREPLGAGSPVGGEPLESHPAFRPMPDDVSRRQGPIGGYPETTGYAGQGL